MIQRTVLIRLSRCGRANGTDWTCAEYSVVWGATRNIPGFVDRLRLGVLDAFAHEKPRLRIASSAAKTTGV